MKRDLPTALRRQSSSSAGVGAFLAIASGFLVSTGIVCLVGLIG